MTKTFARVVALHMHYARGGSEMWDVREPVLAPLLGKPPIKWRELVAPGVLLALVYAVLYGVWIAG